MLWHLLSSTGYQSLPCYGTTIRNIYKEIETTQDAEGKP